MIVADALASASRVLRDIWEMSKETRVHSFGHILFKKHELAGAFGPEKHALSCLLSFGRFTKSWRFFIEYHTKPVH